MRGARLDFSANNPVEFPTHAQHRRQFRRLQQPPVLFRLLAVPRPSIPPDVVLAALAELLAPKIADLLAGDGAVAGKPKKPRRKPAPVCKLKPPEVVPTDLEAARARAVLRQMGVKSR